MEYKEPKCWARGAKLIWTLLASPIWIPLTILTVLWRFYDSALAAWFGKKLARLEGGDLLQKPIEWTCAFTLIGHPWQQISAEERFCPNCHAHSWKSSRPDHESIKR